MGPLGANALAVLAHSRQHTLAAALALMVEYENTPGPCYAALFDPAGPHAPGPLPEDPDDAWAALMLECDGLNRLLGTGPPMYADPAEPVNVSARSLDIRIQDATPSTITVLAALMGVHFVGALPGSALLRASVPAAWPTLATS